MSNYVVNVEERESHPIVGAEHRQRTIEHSVREIRKTGIR